MMTEAKRKNHLAVEIVAEFWGDDAPEWVKAVARESDRSSQAEVGRRIGRSASLINQVLKNRYTGDLHGIEARVKKALSVTAVTCPVLGQISGVDCLKHQNAPYTPSNHMAVRLYVACKRCPNNIGKKGGGDERI